VPLWRAVRTKEWLYAWSCDESVGDWLLYNVEEDPFQMNNRVKDPSCRPILEKLRALKDQWRLDTGDEVDFEPYRAKIKAKKDFDWQHPDYQAKVRAAMDAANRPTAGDPAPPAPVPDKNVKPITRIDFPFDKDAGGWRAENDLEGLAIGNGALEARVKGRQPSLICSPCAIGAKQYGTIRVRMAVKAQGEAGLYWTLESMPKMSGPKSVTVPLQGDGQPHDYVFDVAGNPRWSGKSITALRLALELQGAPPATWTIESIEGEK